MEYVTRAGLPQWTKATPPKELPRPLHIINGEHRLPTTHTVACSHSLFTDFSFQSKHLHFPQQTRTTLPLVARDTRLSCKAKPALSSRPKNLDSRPLRRWRERSTDYLPLHPRLPTARAHRATVRPTRSTTAWRGSGRGSRAEAGRRWAGPTAQKPSYSHLVRPPSSRNQRRRSSGYGYRAEHLPDIHPVRLCRALPRVLGPRRRFRM